MITIANAAIRWGSLTVVAFGLSALPSLANAAPFVIGDVFAAVGSGRVAHYNSAGGFIETLNTTRSGFTTGMAFDQAGNLYVTNFSDNSISRFDSSGNLINAQFVTSPPGAAAPESIVFDASGNFFVGHADGNADVAKYNSAGGLLGTFNVATESRGSDWIDLKADQTTLVYTSEGFQVKQYNTSTNTQLADFATLANRPAFALRLLTDGGALVADSVNVKRLDSGGNTIQAYDVAGNDNFFALNLDPDGVTFWTGDDVTHDLFRFNIASGALIQTIDTDINVPDSQLFGVAVFGERTIAQVPEPSTLALISIALAGLGFGLLRHWRRQPIARA